MTPLETLILVGIIFLAVLFLGHPLSFTLGGLAIIFAATLWGNPGALNIFVRTTNNLITNISYACIPLFLFMGTVLERSGAADDLFESMYVVLGRLRGGLGLTTIVICTLLAAASGVIGASITMMGMLSLPAMLKHRYNPELATGTIMAAGCLGTLIPPSIILVIYGAQAQISIGKLFAGGVGAGLVLSGLYFIYVFLRCLINPAAGPAIDPQEAARYTTKEKLIMGVKSIAPTLMLILLVLGSIFFGVATPTEAAALGAVGALLIALLHRRLTWQMVKESCFATMKTSAMIMYIILAASMFTSVFLGLRGGDVITGIVQGLHLNRWLVLAVILFIIYIMGMFIDSYGVLLVGIPILTPIAYSLGFDPLWFGIIFAVLIQMSYLSPPFAYAVFYLRGIAPKEITTLQLYRSCLPFMALQAISLVILSLFPSIITWLPSKIM